MTESKATEHVGTSELSSVAEGTSKGTSKLTSKGTIKVPKTTRTSKKCLLQ